MKIEIGKIYWAEHDTEHMPCPVKVTDLGAGVNGNTILAEGLRGEDIWELSKDNLYSSKVKCLRAISNNLKLESKYLDAIILEHSNNIRRAKERQTKNNIYINRVSKMIKEEKKYDNR